MDICTFVAGASLAIGAIPLGPASNNLANLTMCFAPVVCEKSADGAREFCRGGTNVVCPSPPLLPDYYSCVRPDRTTYKLTADRKPTG